MNRKKMKKNNKKIKLIRYNRMFRVISVKRRQNYHLMYLMNIRKIRKNKRRQNYHLMYLMSMSNRRHLVFQ